MCGGVENVLIHFLPTPTSFARIHPFIALSPPSLPFTTRLQLIGTPERIANLLVPAAGQVEPGMRLPEGHAHSFCAEARAS